MYSHDTRSGNVMYNAPQSTSKSKTKKNVSNSQLYDEPAFNEQSQKMNPVYGNEENEIKSGGYLDVEPDNEDDDEVTYVNENDDCMKGVQIDDDDDDDDDE